MPSFLLTEKHRQAEKVARVLMVKHGLTNYCFGWMRAKKICGQCSYPSYNRSGVISLSYDYVSLNKEDDIVDTILHEIAHAKCPGAKHGPAWKATCVEIGARPQRCGDTHEILPKGNLIAHCPSCHKEFRRHRLRRGWTYHCRPCGRENGQLTYGRMV